MPAIPSVANVQIPDTPDLDRMHHDRHARLQREMESAGLDGLVLLGTSTVSYATGALAPAADPGRALVARPVVVVVRGQDQPFLLTPYPEGASFGRVYPPVWPDVEEGALALVDFLAGLFPSGSTLAFDEMTHPLREAVAGWSVTSAANVMGAAKVCKTVDELACIRTAQRINELAMRDVHPLLQPGARQTDLSAAFLRRIHELGATSNGIDPIWQVMPRSLSDGPWTTHGGIAFPTPSTDRFLRQGDVIWVDSGIGFQGYASDFGRTWLVGHDPLPTARQEDQFRRWMAVIQAVLERVKPGATGLDLCQAAISAEGGKRPWIDHFYLSHGVGTDSAEMPLIGTDLGDSFDEACVLAPGMVLVLEPVIWDDGFGGYRSEDIFAVTDDGWVALSDHTYHPFGAK
jgi:Xaa-Pro aminopeptidase